MIAGSIARRYGKALLEIGVAAKSYEAMGKKLDEVVATIEKSPELRSALSSPIFPLSQRRAILDAVAKRLGVSVTLHNFMMVLLDANRFDSLPMIAREYGKLVDEQAGRVRAVVTSAKPLPPMLEARILAALERKTGKTVLLEKREDASLIGGVLTQIGDVIYDGTVKSQLASMREELLAE